MYLITGILGLAFAIAPFLFGYQGNTVAMYSSIILGSLVVLASAVEFFQEDKEMWEYWVAGILGIVAIAAPFVLNFSNHTNAMWTSVIAGALIAVFAGSRFVTGQQGKA